MEYTKGEWEQETVELRTWGEPIKHIFISATEGGFAGRTLADIGYWRDFPDEMVQSNAHLIAASPMMYEALVKIRAMVSDTIVYDIANSALVKVEGGK